MSSEGAPTQSVFLVGSAGKASTDLRRPCGPSAGSAPALLDYAYHKYARCTARRFTRIWTTWIAESLAESFRPRLLGRVRPPAPVARPLLPLADELEPWPRPVGAARRRLAAAALKLHRPFDTVA